MRPHPDFAETRLPRDAWLGAFHLTPLSVAQVAEDFANVTASEAVLVGTFGDDWPKGLTLAANLVDMGWHEREFTARRSFAWIVRDPDGVYAGCAYLYPAIGERGRGEVVTWMIDTPDRPARLAAFNAAFRDWLTPFLPEGYALDWTSNDAPGGRAG